MYLRIWTIFQFNNKTPAQVLYMIIKWRLNDKMNAKIEGKLDEIYLPDKINKCFYIYIYN